MSNHVPGGGCAQMTPMTQLSIPNHFGLPSWEKIGKSEKLPKLGILNHFGPLWQEKIGKSAELSKFGSSNDFGPF